MEGTDLRLVDLQGIRRQISYVPQDVFLFSETVENNIKFGEPGATHEQVVQAARQANVDAEIERFSDKYETLIGERGVTLSGGQKQRISIARALIKKPGLVVFDDCLSAVDTKTEKEIITNLNNYLEGKTAIIITHRIFSLFDFDKIIVLDNGKIVEQGTHQELVSIANGYYAGLYTRQQEQEKARQN